MPSSHIKQLQFRIESILGGISPTFAFGPPGQFNSSVAIDTENPYASQIKPSGLIMPIRSRALVGTSGLGSTPLWITGAQTSTGVFIYCDGGTLYTLSQTLGMDEEAGVGVARTSTANVGAGNGMVYYNDYIYMSTQDDIARFGKLSATAPSFANNYWLVTLGQSAMSSSITYPGIRSITYPSHPMHVHVDGVLYVADYGGNPVSGGAGKLGRVHSISTQSDGTSGTGTLNALILPSGFMPMDIESYNRDLAILCTPEGSYASGAVPKSGDSALFLWSAMDGATSYYRHVPIHEALATALINKNGELYILAGGLDRPVKLMKYLGGFSFETLFVWGEGSPPPAGAVDIVGNMICWGNYGTIPQTFSSVMAYGYRTGALPETAYNNIMRITSADTNPIIGALKFISSAVSTTNYPMIGWRTTSNFGLDAQGGTGAYSSMFRSELFHIGNEFLIRRIRVPFPTSGIAAGVTITPKVWVDSLNASTTLTVINNTNYTGLDSMIDYRNLTIQGWGDFLIEFAFTGTTELPINLPVIIDVDVYDN